MSDQFANVPILNLVPLLIVISIYFIVVIVACYRYGASLSWWAFVIGAGGLVLLEWQKGTIIAMFNYGVRFLNIVASGGLEAEGGLDALQNGTNAIIRCTPETATTCNETGFLFLTWLAIVIFGNLTILCIYSLFKLSSTSNGWAMVAGFANAWLYGFVLLPPLCRIFGYDLEIDPFTGLWDAFIAFIRTVWDLFWSVMVGLWDLVSLPYWVAIFGALVLLLIWAASSVRKASTGSSSSGS